VGDDSALDLADFDRYVEEHGIPEEHYPAAFALWIAEKTGGPVPRFEKVEERTTSQRARGRFGERWGTPPCRVSLCLSTATRYPESGGYRPEHQKQLRRGLADGARRADTRHGSPRGVWLLGDRPTLLQAQRRCGSDAVTFR
jgi:hypothetical protein